MNHIDTVSVCAFTVSDTELHTAMSNWNLCIFVRFRNKKNSAHFVQMQGKVCDLSGGENRGINPVSGRKLKGTLPTLGERLPRTSGVRQILV